MKKKVMLYGVLPLVVLVLVLYVLSSYTHTGRVWSLYVFAAPKAPLGVKYDCIKNTNQQVYEKFLQPLNFDEGSKNALREYWHFSYFRACLFRAGYDFWGNDIVPTSLTSTTEGKEYHNPFVQLQMIVPTSTTLVFDNVINPDLDDYLIASMLQVGPADIHINADRSYKVPDLQAASNEFAGFNSVKDFPSPTLQQAASPKPNALAFSDGDYYGYVMVVPDKHLVTVFVNQKDKDILNMIMQTATIEDRN